MPFENGAGEAGIAAQASYFHAESESHRSQAIRWLIAAASCALLTALYAWGVAADWIPGAPPAQASVGQVARYVLSRIVFLSLLLYAVAWTAKNYRAHKHNQIVNTHRETALKTFRTFVSATEDAQVKNAILVQATQSIFSAQASGYLGEEPEPLPQSTVIEVLRKVGGEPK